MDTVPVSLQSKSEMRFQRFERKRERESTMELLGSQGSRQCLQLVGILPIVKILLSPQQSV